mgnify:CR=1 FL=1|jgi:hypothetical protein
MHRWRVQLKEAQRSSQIAVDRSVLIAAEILEEKYNFSVESINLGRQHCIVEHRDPESLTKVLLFETEIPRLFEFITLRTRSEIRKKKERKWQRKYQIK